MKTLIVVDMQNDFITGSLGTQEAQAILPNVQAKIEEYKKNNDYIIFTQDTHQPDYLNTAEGIQLPITHCIQNTKGWQIPEELDIKNDSKRVLHVLKSTFGTSIWSQFPYKTILRDNVKIEIVGVCTDICIVTNALLLKTYYPDVQIVVDASCCAGTTPEAHQAALQILKNCQVKVINE